MSKVCSRCEKHLVTNKFYCNPCSLELERARWNNLPVEKRRAKWLKTKYKITHEQYLDMYNNQNGECKICTKPISLNEKTSTADTACVDHCHISKKIRGLLCNHCNRALGLMKDSKENLKRMIDYLNEAET